MSVFLKILSYIVFPFYALLFITMLCIWDVAQKVAVFFGERALQKAVYGLNYGMMCTLYPLGTKIVLNEAPEVDLDQPYIIVSNHQSMFDMPLLYKVFSKLKPRYIAKKELTKWIPGISVCLRKTQAALIDRQSPRQAISEIIRLTRRMKSGKFSTIIFPEGTRAKGGKMKPFRESGLKALLTKLPESEVLPVAIEGTWKLTRNKYGVVPLFQRIEILPGLPISRLNEQGVNKSIDEMFEESESAVNSLHEKLNSSKV